MMRVLASLALAACMLLTGTRRGQMLIPLNPTCWVSGDLVGDGNPIDIHRALCGATVGAQTAVLE
jgi:hypothetical protein